MALGETETGMIKIGKILCPTDFSELSSQALRYAKSFTKSFDATLHMLYVVDESYQYWMAMGPNTIPAGPSTEDLVQAGKEQMKAFRQEHLADLSKVVTEVRLGRPFMEIIHYAREQAVDLIVIGTHGRGGISHVLMGSTAEKVVRKAPCPVLSIRHPQHQFIMP